MCVFYADHDRVVGFKEAGDYSGEEERRVHLSNTTLRKQVVEYGRTDVEQKDKIDSLEKELTASFAVQKVAQTKLENTLRQMKSVAVDDTLHERVELMEDFKARKHIEWDLDYEIDFWKEREAELAEAREEGEAIGEPSTPRAVSPRTTKPVQVEVDSETAT